MLDRAKVDAIMVSFIKLDKRLQRTLSAGLPWAPRTYLDSGVFTFMRRAGVVGYSSPSTRIAGTWEEFKVMAASYADYLKREKSAWDHIIELDVDEIFGVERADMFRRNLHDLLGDRLLPVWHAQRGEEGWDEMIKTFPYVAMSISRAAGGRNTRRNHTMIRQMVERAHARGVQVHLLGGSTMDYFEDYHVDTMDASSWSAGVRWGELKINRGKVLLPKFETRTRRTLVHSHLAQLRDLVGQWGFTLEQVRTDYMVRIEVGIRLLLLRQEEVRNARSKAQAVS